MCDFDLSGSLPICTRRPPFKKRFVYLISINFERRQGTSLLPAQICHLHPFCRFCAPTPRFHGLCSQVLAPTVFFGCFLGPLWLPYQYGELEVLGTLHPTRDGPWPVRDGFRTLKEKLPRITACSRVTLRDHAEAGTSWKWNLYLASSPPQAAPTAPLPFSPGILT